MAAITWRNVDAPDFRSAGALMGQASRSFDHVGNALTNAVAAYQAEQQKALDFRKDKNTNDFLNSLYSQYQTPEALQAAIQSGDIARQMQGYGNEVDFKQTRGAAEKMLGEQQQRALTDLTFQGKMREEANAVPMAEATAALYRGDRAAYDNAMTRVDPRFQGSMAKTAYDVAGTDQTRQIAADGNRRQEDSLKINQDKLRMEQDMHPLKMQAMRDQSAASRASTAASYAAAEASKARALVSKGELSAGASAKAQDGAISSVVAAANKVYDDNAKGVDAIGRKAADAGMIPKNADGTPAYNKMTPGQRDAFEQVVKDEGGGKYSLKMRLGEEDANLQTEVFKHATSIPGLSAKKLTELKEQIPILIGQGRNFDFDSTEAGKKALARRAEERKMEEQTFGGLRPANEIGEQIKIIEQTVPKKHLDNVVAGYLSAMQGKGNIKDSNGTPYILDGATAARLANEKIGKGVGFFYDTNTPSDGFSSIFNNHVTRNKDELQKTSLKVAEEKLRKLNK